MSSLPSYEKVCRRFGFPVPWEYYRLLEVAFLLNPDDPWNALEPLNIISLNSTLANPDYTYPGYDYPDTPVEIYVIGWTGTDGGHYGFVVDDIPSRASDLPIAEVYPGEGCRLLGMTLSDFISVMIAESVAEYGYDWLIENDSMIKMVKGVIDYSPPEDIDAHLLRIQRQRVEAGAVITLDGCGTIVPKDRIDWLAWDKIDWEKYRASNDIPHHVLSDAESRIRQGDDITAFLIARNFRYLYWHSDFNEERQYMRRTGAIMEKVYETLDRVHLAKKIRAQTEWAVREVR